MCRCDVALPLTVLVPAREPHLVDPTASSFYNVHLPMLCSAMCRGHKGIVLPQTPERKHILLHRHMSDLEGVSNMSWTPWVALLRMLPLSLVCVLGVCCIVVKVRREKSRIKPLLLYSWGPE